MPAPHHALFVALVGFTTDREFTCTACSAGVTLPRRQNILL